MSRRTLCFMYRPNSLHCRWLGVWGVNKKLTLCLVCAQAKISAHWTERVGGGGGYMKRLRPCFICVQAKISAQWTERVGGLGGYMKRLRPYFICAQAKISALLTERVGGGRGYMKRLRPCFICVQAKISALQQELDRAENTARQLKEEQMERNLFIRYPGSHSLAHSLAAHSVSPHH